MSPEDITLGVEHFSDEKCILRGYSKLYKGGVQSNNEVLIKRFSRPDQDRVFYREFEVLFKHKQENIISLVGYCTEMDDNIIVYDEHASKGCLNRYLNDTSFSWSTRLKVCIDIAKGLNFLHGGDGQDVVIHSDLKSSNILLTKDWKAKICGFELALTYPANEKIECLKNDVVGSPGYCDPLHSEDHYFTKESDMYSFGLILFDILCGRLACPQDLEDHVEVARLDEIVFQGIKEQIVQESLVIFQNIAFQCLNEKKEERPTAGEVVAHLQEALEFQEAYEIWEANLPRNYNEILQISKSPEIYSTMRKKDIHDVFSKGILVKDDSLWFSIGDNGERNEMITARKFSFRNRWSHKWRSIQESRFHKVAEMLDIRNLNIQIKIRTQLLPPDVKYSVHLVFKFFGLRRSHAKWQYVNLKYKMGGENLHAYFATWRDDDWMMIELCRFSDSKKDTNFEVLLDGFSRCYCDSRSIYIEGIEFRAIDNVRREKNNKLEENQQVLTSLSEMTRVVNRMESSTAVMYEFSNVTPCISEPSAQSRGTCIYKVLPWQVFCIKWYINAYQMVSPNTECICYLVFKLSENCHGLHCHVIVRDQFRKKSKEIIYFRSPSPWNLHDNDHCPKERSDGWMEVVVSKFNSDVVLKKGSIFGNLKFISYEGTMSGLVICGLEFRPKEE